MAGAIAARSSIASCPLTSSMVPNFFMAPFGALPQLFQPQYFGIVLHALGCCEPWERHQPQGIAAFLPAIACLQLREALRRGDEFFAVAPVQIILLRVKGKADAAFRRLWDQW